VRVPSRGGREITFLDLATHRSGLPRLPTNFEPSNPANPYADFGAEELYDFLSRYELERDIGAEFEYSNLGVGLLGYALARAADDVDYGTLVRERILSPLGMEKSGIELTDEMRRWMAQGHDERGNPVPRWDSGVLAGAGGLESDMRDMLRFLEANVGAPQSVLEEAMRDAHMARPVGEPGAVPGSGASSPAIGLNWLTVPAGDSVIVWHNGATGGFRSFIGFDPSRDIGVVVLTNSGQSVDDIGLHLLDARIPLAVLTSGWWPGWGVGLLLLGFAVGVALLEVLGAPRKGRAGSPVGRVAKS
jgi:CubicO group peptidase (beta-lactamase class C family)